MRSKSGRGPGGCPPELPEPGPGRLGNLQVENQGLRTRVLVFQEGLPSFLSPLALMAKQALVETIFTRVSQDTP